jgi:hypothetical protein
MANGHGGSRTPNSPAAVSGPGALSRRTDGGPQQQTSPMTGMGYGENADFNEMQQAAPLAASRSAKSPAVKQRQAKTTGKQAAIMATPIFAPTTRPDEPVTAGSDVGPGPGYRSIPSARPTSSLAQTLEKLLPYDQEGDIGEFYRLAVSRGW